jgi:hypothetical protein
VFEVAEAQTDLFGVGLLHSFIAFAVVFVTGYGFSSGLPLVFFTHDLIRANAFGRLIKI